MSAIDPRTRQRVEDTIGGRVVGWSPRSDGLTHALAGVATLGDGSTLFVKAATDAETAAALLREIALLDALDAPFLPRRRGTVRDALPILLLENLSHGHWPEPYPADLSLLDEALDQLRSLPVPAGLDLPELEGPSEEIRGAVLENAAAATPALVPWLDRWLGVIAESAPTPPSGRALVHSDLWYSNLCFLEDRLVIVDWSDAHVGNPWFDTSTVNIDLILEGRRPLPMEDAAGWAAVHLTWVVWALARGAGPGISDPSRWRLDNLELVDGAAWWLAYELGLPAPPVLTDRTPGYRSR